jgi:hypothetical protein
MEQDVMGLLEAFEGGDRHALDRLLPWSTTSCGASRTASFQRERPITR